MKIIAKFDNSTEGSGSAILKRKCIPSAVDSRRKRKGIVQRFKEAAMTIVGNLMPEHWDYLWSWEQSPHWGHGHRGNVYGRWREPAHPVSPTRSPSSGREIHIPIQIVGSSSYNESSQSVLCDEWSDSDSDDLNNSSSTKMRKKRRQRQSNITLTSSNDSLLNGAVSKSEEDIEYDLKRKVGISQRLDHSENRYNTRSSSVSAKNDETVLIRSDSEEQEINDTCSYSVYKYLKAFLASSGRQVDSIKGDGNCFFRALSKIIYGNQSYYDDIRQAVVDVEEKYPKKFEAFADGPIDRHIQDMRLDKTWATQTEIYAAATLLNRDFYILSPDQTGENYRWLLFQPQAQYNKNFTGCKCYVTICHTHGNHYDRIAPLHGQCNCDLDPPHLTGVKGQVDLTEEDEIV